MAPIALSLLACLMMLFGAMIGVQLRRKLPVHHFDEHTKDIVRLGASLVATIVALVLGLLINSANAGFEAQRSEVRHIAADLILLDHLLEGYGPEAHPIRLLLRRGVDEFVQHVWQTHDIPLDAAPMMGPGSTASQALVAIHALPAPDNVHRTVQSQAVQLAMDTARVRLVLFERAQASIPYAIYSVLVFWMTALFASFCRFTPVNRAAAVALIVIALSVSVALFLILELDQAFAGMMRVPSRAFAQILPPLAP